MTFRMITLFIILIVRISFGTSLVVSPMEISFESKPGEEDTKAVKIVNSSMTDTISIKAYFEDKNLSKNKSALYLSRICNDWLFISPQTMTLKPQETKSVRIDINIPEDKTLNGDFWSRFFIEQTSNIQNKIIESPAGARFKVNVVTRWAVNITQTIPGTLVPNLSLLRLNVINQDSTNMESVLTTEFKVENTGNKILMVAGNLTYRDVDGIDILTDPISRKRVH